LSTIEKAASANATRRYTNSYIIIYYYYALQLEGRPTNRQSFFTVLTKFLLPCAQTAISLSRPHSYIAIKFIDNDFLKESIK